ncbi:LysR substrate-binding domain-containing protein [Rhodococcus pyridinivorans]|uniref:LysR substrate-binding domain-containing protein n=1 Tax=Rhodococcus pyridinivorans TaxID=103816 RepID=UPI0020C74F92|nr:LysR substrate-binding domain-containing protein [Rhodococcus pyridinivorans]
MAAFRRRYPDIKMTVLHPRSNAAVYTLVATGECELAFARIDRAPSDVHTVELGAESLAVLLPPAQTHIRIRPI